MTYVADSHGGMRRKVLVGLGLCLTWLTAGCMTYEPAGKAWSSSQAQIETSVPERWLQFTPAKPSYVITRDGLRLEKITIDVTKIGKPLAGTERTYREGMTAREMADLAAGILAGRDDMSGFRVERIEPVTIAGAPGFRVLATFTDPAGLRKRLCLCGAMIRGYVCEFKYESAEQTYFDRYLAEFEKMVTSARPLGGAG
jgi:hypothetical protein